MIFSKRSIAFIECGAKTQARFPLDSRHTVHYTQGKVAAVYVGPMLKWEVGRRYAMQPGRGQPACGHFTLLSLRVEPLHKISLADALAEGYTTELNFRRRWEDLHPTGLFAWSRNPWVAVLTIKYLKPNIQIKGEWT